MDTVSAVPLIAAILVFLASIISLRLGISVAIVELLLGVIAGNYFGLQPEPWMAYLAGFGGIVLTFLAGAEVDLPLLRSKFKESMLIGGASFLVPFVCAFGYTYVISGWSLDASLIAGAALSTTSLAVVYSVLVETGLSRTGLGKLLMSATFVTDIGTALALSILFIKPNLGTLEFVIISGVIIYFAVKHSRLLFSSNAYKNKVIEPEIKYIFLLLIIFMYFAAAGASHAVLPAFFLGLFMSPYFTELSDTKEVRNRLRTVAYALITPFFFIVGGMNVSLPLVLGAFGLFVALFALKQAAKFIGVYFLARRYLPKNEMYSTLLMSTGLTFGTISSVFGYQAGYIDKTQFSVLVAVVVASAVIPTIIAQKWFKPVHTEDILNGNGK
ncbi:cation:proton antiporter [Candidatus Micrarchaeota archaeon CG10_big_fil_rev_8_21_14_0_10_45_29]|nr:MAG: cation:proton antiporter [Candidatus Micrarchaeota archaeon CG10_big_fil_rev_8_21_14_0_10_45_29]